MKIAVTGCHGRVGRPTVNAALARGHDVVGIDAIAPPDSAAAPSVQCTYHQADLTDFERCLELLKGCDAVIHLAGYPNPGDFKVETHNTNVVLSWNVLRASAELGITRVAQASSVNILTMVYSAASAIQYFPIDEDHPCTPDEPYGLSKLIAETQATTLVRRYPKMRIASLRLSWSVPQRKVSADRDPYDAWTARDLWGYVQEDSVADAFIRAVTVTTKPPPTDGARGHVNGEVNGEREPKMNGVGAVNGTVGSAEPAPTVPWTSGHEAFFIVAPQIAHKGDSKALKERFWPDIPIKEGRVIEGMTGFFDCSKARNYLGWVHKDE